MALGSLAGLGVVTTRLVPLVLDGMVALLAAAKSPRSVVLGHLLVGLTVVVVWSCKGEGKEDAGPDRIPNDSGVIGAGDDRDDTGYSFPADTFDGGGLDEFPDNTLELRHTGYWDLTPLGGPYETLIGDLHIDELIDGDPDQQWCYALFGLTGFGLAPEDYAGCASCDVAFEVEFYLVEEGGFKPFEGAEPIDSGDTYDERDVYEVNGLDECRSSDLPADGDRWQMGWSEAEQTIYINYFGSDIWLPWYAGEQTLDKVTFAWIEQFGFVVPEMEDE